MQQRYEKPVVEVVDAEELIESVGAKAATSVSVTENNSVHD